MLLESSYKEIIIQPDVQFTCLSLVSEKSVPSDGATPDNVHLSVSISMTMTYIKSCKYSPDMCSNRCLVTLVAETNRWQHCVDHQLVGIAAEILKLPGGTD